MSDGVVTSEPVAPASPEATTNGAGPAEHRPLTEAGPAELPATTAPTEAPAPEASSRARGRAGRIEALEARVKNLEQTLAGLQPSRPPVRKPLERPPANAEEQAASVPEEVPEPAAPAAEAPVAAVAADPPAAPAPLAAMAPDPPTAAVAAPAPSRGPLLPLRRGWFVLECLYDLRNALRMIGDPRYRMTWLGRLLPIGFLAFYILSDMDSLRAFFPWNLVPAVGWLINKVIVLLFGFVTFKVLLREIRRYRETIPDALE